MKDSKYIMHIGLEVHIRLNTNSKLFSSSPNLGSSEIRNSCADYIDLGFPGTLPLLNEAALESIVKLGLLLNSQIAPWSYMDRKQYFYPDMSKGFQITQSSCPILTGGHLELESGKCVNIRQAHLEEDAGRLYHSSAATLVDYNRCGAPLIELVTHPEMHTAEEVFDFLKNLRSLVRKYDISTANMESGEFKADVNVSLRPESSEILGQKCEIKNLNSFRLITRAINQEFERQHIELEAGREIKQESLSFDENRDTNVFMRSKESAGDYRVIPEFNIPPIIISQHTIQKLAREIESVTDISTQTKEALSPDEREIMLKFPRASKYYGDLAAHTSPQTAFKWVYLYLIPIFKKLNLNFVDELVPVIELLELMSAVEREEVDIPNAKKIIESFIISEESFSNLIDKLQEGYDVNSISSTCRSILESDPDSVKAYMDGSQKIVGYFMGKVLKELSQQGIHVLSSHKVLSILQEELERMKNKVTR